MSTLKDILASGFDEIGGEAGQAALRLLRAFVAVAEATSNSGVHRAEKAKVMAELSAIEARTPSDDVVRQRLTALNAAVEALAADGGVPKFHMSSERTHLALKFENPEASARGLLLRTVELSTEQDTSTVGLSLQTPRAGLGFRTYQVFISHRERGA
ncbi:MAG: hypothetical protein CGW95_13920 [Phenylobacterium zucineum]|nr:MAG: hypothetical protein CGW95_13920 [Phenylobacterium zucineum]